MIYDVCHAAGGMSKYEWERDPKRLGFILARYKVVAKMLAGKPTAIEVGCADGFGSRVVAQTVGHLTAIDIDAESIKEAKAQNSKKWHVSFSVRDAMSPRLLDTWDAVYALDVLEHIDPAREFDFILSLRQAAPVCIIGTPSLESQTYASALSKQGHVNCKSGEALRELCSNYWKQVFMFGMNDETLHTGFLPMSHYIFAVCVR